MLTTERQDGIAVRCTDFFSKTALVYILTSESDLCTVPHGTQGGNQIKEVKNRITVLGLF